jgi:molecular chaperone GrpE (heat shock protein)
MHFLSLRGINYSTLAGTLRASGEKRAAWKRSRLQERKNRIEELKLRAQRLAAEATNSRKAPARRSEKGSEPDLQM